MPGKPSRQVLVDANTGSTLTGALAIVDCLEQRYAR